MIILTVNLIIMTGARRVLALGTAAGAILTLAVVRLTLVDEKLDRLDMRANFFDWAGDRPAREVDDMDISGRAESRVRVHPFSAKSPRYDSTMLSLRVLSLLNALSCARLPDRGITMAAVRVGLGVQRHINGVVSKKQK